MFFVFDPPYTRTPRPTARMLTALDARARGAGARSSLAARSGLPRTPKGKTQISDTEVAVCDGRAVVSHFKKSQAKGEQFTNC